MVEYRLVKGKGCPHCDFFNKRTSSCKYGQAMTCNEIYSKIGYLHWRRKNAKNV